jgi:predicted chitinase
MSDKDGNESTRVERIAFIVNGGYNGFEDRKNIFDKLRPALVN